MVWEAERGVTERLEGSAPVSERHKASGEVEPWLPVLRGALFGQLSPTAADTRQSTPHTRTVAVLTIAV